VDSESRGLPDTTADERGGCVREGEEEEEEARDGNVEVRTEEHDGESDLQREDVCEGEGERGEEEAATRLRPDDVAKRN
jgi:hypothetical protein